MSISPRASFNSAVSAFAAFRHRNYRLWFFGQLVSLLGTWMQRIAQGYLLYTLTGSVAYLGYVGFISGMPAWLFILFGGLIADRVPRRTLLVTTLTVKMILALILGGLVVIHWVQPWHILALALFLGVANAFSSRSSDDTIIEKTVASSRQSTRMRRNIRAIRGFCISALSNLALPGAQPAQNPRHVVGPLLKLQACDSAHGHRRCRSARIDPQAGRCRDHARRQP